MKCLDLRELLEYKNPKVLRMYELNYPNNKLPGEQAFREVLKHLWFSQVHAQERRDNPDDPSLPNECLMLRSMKEIDDMWHEFILFTRDYTDFCFKYFGEYMHHLPNIYENRPLPREILNQEIAKLLPYTFDKLGEETMRTWYAMYLEET